MFLKEAAITTLRASRNVYRQNMERFHNTTIAAITIATSTTNWIDRDEMNPNRDRNSHMSANSRKPNDEHDYSYRSQGPKSELQHTRKTLGTLSWVSKEDDYFIVIGNGSPCSGSVSSLLKPTRHLGQLQPEQVVLRSKDSRSKPPLVTNFYISVNNTKLHNG